MREDTARRVLREAGVVCKQCRRCPCVLPLPGFTRNAKYADGRETVCRHCRSRVAVCPYGNAVKPREPRYPHRIRFPVWPLLKAIGVRPDDDDWRERVAATVGVKPATLDKRVQRGSLSWPMADVWAVRCGLHPGDVWPDLWWP